MSTIKVDAIQHTGGTTGMALASNGIVTIQGEGTATTNLQKGLAKSRIEYTTASTFVTSASFNIASLTDGGAGAGYPVFTNNMADTAYSYVGMSNEYTTYGSATGKATTGYRQFSGRYSDGANVDVSQNSSIVYGDLA
jgi:hypothetical protein|tara:strand:- start:20 stop:433 length:414 start_codon:yes stop_codon:yes gene_type:complete